VFGAAHALYKDYEDMTDYKNNLEEFSQDLRRKLEEQRINSEYRRLTAEVEPHLALFRKIGFDAASDKIIN
jgi:hypothetical protein